MVHYFIQRFRRLGECGFAGLFNKVSKEMNDFFNLNFTLDRIIMNGIEKSALICVICEKRFWLFVKIRKFVVPKESSITEFFFSLHPLPTLLPERVDAVSPLHSHQKRNLLSVGKYEPNHFP